MPALLTNEQLREALKFEYSSRTVLKDSKKKRMHNIEAFLKIDRSGLKYNELERKLLLYETLQNEKIFIQFPGKESINNPEMPYDFRPKLELNDGTYMQDASFGYIWDILDQIGKEHKAYLSYIASIFLRMGYMHEYLISKDTCVYVDIDIQKGCKDNSLKHKSEIVEWYKISLSKDVWHTLNDKIGPIEISESQHISLEAFIKFVDLLFQNEDCKYYYNNVYLKKVTDYKLTSGRTNSSAANLLILNYFEGNEKISNLLNAFQKSRGVASFNKSNYSVVTDEIVINVDKTKTTREII